MVYEKQTWEDYPSTNSPITSDRLSHIEQGIYDNSTTLQTIATTAQNIIESGSNANGNFVKYSDGTMVCYGTVYTTNPTHNDWYGFCRISNEFTFSLAKAFKDNNYSLTISSTTYGYFSTIITSITTNSFGFRAFTHNQDAYTPNNGVFNYIAIGKWE